MQIFIQNFKGKATVFLGQATVHRADGQVRPVDAGQGGLYSARDVGHHGDGKGIARFSTTGLPGPGAIIGLLFADLWFFKS